MIKGALYPILLFLFFVSFDKPIEGQTFQVTLSDSVRFDVKALTDSLGLPHGYEAVVLTPVCEVDKCYAIQILLEWDLIGRYQTYDTIPGQPLTKLDHEPFTADDYQKLHQILSNANSVLASYKKEELVRDTRTSSIDGFTGATIREVKESVIGGAVYSCYTLWHISHGAVANSLQLVTKSIFNKALVNKLVNEGDQDINYYLINIFSADDFSTYLPEVLLTIQDGKGYFAKNAIEKMPSGVVNQHQAQRFFTNEFDQLNYFAQVALLGKLDKNVLDDSLKNVIESHLDNRNSHKNELIRKLTEDQL